MCLPGQTPRDIKASLSSLQGFEAVVDSKKEYPLTKRDSVLIRPGHNVSRAAIFSSHVRH